MISSAEWAQFEVDLSTFNSEVGQQPVLWKHVSIDLPRYNEGESKTFESRVLDSVVSYNDFRVRPIGDEEPSGVIDREYCYLLLNNTSLATNGWLDASGNFTFNATEDIFIVNGIEYTSMGDTPASQASTKPLYNIIVLRRRTSNTGG